MEAVQKDSWYSLALLTFLVFLKATLQERGEHVTLADGMILDCLCPWNGNLSMVSWTKVPDKSAMAIYHPIYGTDFAPKYLDRLTFLRRTTMDGSVSFGNVTEQDAGLYRCSMQTFPLGTWTRDVQVIKENLSPYVELDFREGSNLTLVCPHHNYTVKHVLIKKDENETIGRCAMQGGALVSEDLHEGVQVNCADLVEGVSFELNNVAEADQGLYQCLLTTENGVEITTYLLTVRNQDAPYPPPNHPEEAAVSPTLTQAQVLEDPDPAEGTAITELPSSDAENGVPNSSAPTERMLTTDSVSSDTTNSVHHPSAPTEEIPTTDTVPPAIGTTMLHLPDPAVTEDLYSTKLAPAVIATTAIHLPEACREPVVVGPCRGAFPRFYYNATTHSCQTFLFGGCREKANNFLSREECESTCRGGAAPSEELSTTEPAPSLVDTTMLPSRAPPEEELTPESLPPVPATTVRLPPDPTEETTTTEQPPPTKTTTASPASDWPFWSWVDIPDQYWIFIYAGAGAVGLLLLILTIVLVIVCRRRRRREAYRVRMHPGKRWRDSEQGGFYDRMRKGTRFGRQEPVYANVRTGPKHKHKPKQKRRR